MAPVAVTAYRPSNVDIHVQKGDSYTDKQGVTRVSEEHRSSSKYPEWLPTWNPAEKFPATPFFKHDDPALRADPELKNLFPEKLTNYSHSELSPKLGLEIKDSRIQLSQLNDLQKNDLALLVAQRGVVVFRNQDLKDQGLEFNKKFGSYFGPLHVHPTSGAPDKYPQFHITYRKSDAAAAKKLFASTNTTIAWHSDITYETQPPGVTFFTQLDGPSTGGDTLFADCIEAYDRLSPTMQQIVENLKVIHTSREQAYDSRRKHGIERKPPVDSIHPLVRYHPALNKKSLFIHKGFARRIVGLKDQENEALLKFLFEHIEKSQDLQVRARYEPGTVVAWDNRRVLHSACLDWTETTVRHCYRITPQAERPVGSREEYENWTVEKEERENAIDRQIVEQYYGA